MSDTLSSKMRKGTVERLKAALAKDPSLVTGLNALEVTEGSTEEYLATLGLLKSDLLRLERCGFAVRGYSPNITPPPEELETAWTTAIIKKKVPMRLSNGYVRYTREEQNVRVPRYTMRGKGHRVKWVILGDEGTGGTTRGPVSAGDTCTGPSNLQEAPQG